MTKFRDSARPSVNIYRKYHFITVLTY